MTGGFDPAAASVARMWDAASGGRNYHPADAETLAKILEIWPGAADTIPVIRAFSRRVIEASGLPQVLELGSGLDPSHVLDAAQYAGASVAFADSDPIIAAELPVALGWIPDPAGEVAVACADLRDPGAVLGHPDVKLVIDPARPLLALMSGVLHLMEPEEAASAVAAWARILAPGSVVAVAVPAIPDSGMRQRLEAISPGRYGATAGMVKRWLAGFGDVRVGRMNRFGCIQPGSGTGPHVIGAAGKKP